MYILPSLLPLFILNPDYRIFIQMFFSACKVLMYHYGDHNIKSSFYQIVHITSLVQKHQKLTS